jgi:hypothetical protein
MTIMTTPLKSDKKGERLNHVMQMSKLNLCCAFGWKCLDLSLKAAQSGVVSQ